MPENKIISFSINPTDKEGLFEVQKLKDHCKKTGTNFSFLIIRAVTNLNKELNL